MVATSNAAWTGARENQQNNAGGLLNESRVLGVPYHKHRIIYPKPYSNDSGPYIIKLVKSWQVQEGRVSCTWRLLEVRCRVQRAHRRNAQKVSAAMSVSGRAHRCEAID